MLFFGADPDLHTTGIALIDEHDQLTNAWCVRAKGKQDRDGSAAMCQAIYAWRMTQFLDFSIAAAVEGQELYRGTGKGDTKNSRDILFLAPISGALMVVLTAFSGKELSPLYFPAPGGWKGQTPKQIKQARILERAKLKYKMSGSQDDGYCYPLSTSFDIKQTEWKHVTDAIGLAQYARDRYFQEQGKAQFLATTPATTKGHST